MPQVLIRNNHPSYHIGFIQQYISAVNGLSYLLSYTQGVATHGDVNIGCLPVQQPITDKATDHISLAIVLRKQKEFQISVAKRMQKY